MIQTVLGNQFPAHQGHTRSGGWHMKSILVKINSHITGVVYEDPPPQGIMIMGDIGLLVESGLASRLPEYVWQPGEFDADGIVGSPDAIDLANNTLIECKITWSSISRTPETDFIWKHQGAGYCYLLTVATGQPWRHCLFYVTYMCGDYSRPIRPQRCVYLLEYTEQDLLDTWKMITNYVKGQPSNG